MTLQCTTPQRRISATVIAPRHSGAPCARLYPADGLRLWDVGVRLGAALRRAQARAASDGPSTGDRHIAPHVRGAHWHTYLTGPRKAVDPTQRHRELRWLPPIPIGLEDYDALVPTIHPVRLERDDG